MLSNHSLIKWQLVIIYLKKWVKNRYNKIKDTHKVTLTQLNNEFKFNPNLKQQTMQLSVKPQHITPLDCYSIFNSHHYITQKADGIYKKSLFKCSPDISNLELDFSLIEYEFNKKENMCYIFNYLDTSLHCYYFIIMLRKYHPFIDKAEYEPLSINNYKRVLDDYICSESQCLEKFKKNKKKYVKKWWPKYIFKLNCDTQTDYLTILDYTTTIKVSILDTDGSDTIWCSGYFIICLWLINY